MQITHEEAHRLIQFDTDNALNSHQKSDLVAHLDDCEECKLYAESIQGIGSLLRPLFQRNWNRQPVPLLMPALVSKRNQSSRQGSFLATRIAVIGIICISFVFSVWQFTVSTPSMPEASLITVPPMPTPATRLVSMTSTSSNCAGGYYRVQENDTLEGIAARFAVSKEEILTSNGILAESLRIGMKIVIPACTSTPTETVNAQTTTYTPSRGPITSTPGG